MVEVNRRAFLVGTGLAAAGAFAEDDKVVDGGFAEVTPPGVPVRARPVLPPGAGGLAAFSRKCVGCQLCVQLCPTHVLRPSTDPKRLAQPEMGFARGYCRPECTTCGEVCPAGAIRPVKTGQKRNVHVGRAVWHADRCLAASEGVPCDACRRHCPVQAVSFVPLDEHDASAPKVPVVDLTKCIGCGACEHLCPARPLPAIFVKGFERQRVVRPFDEGDLLAEMAGLVRRGEAAAVTARDGVIQARASGRGVLPLLKLLDDGHLRHALVVDKVIGRAAAAVCLVGRARRVHGLLMSEEAQSLLAAHNVPATADRLVPKILNRDQSASCPLEARVAQEADPQKMVADLRAFLGANVP